MTRTRSRRFTKPVLSLELHWQSEGLPPPWSTGQPGDWLGLATPYLDRLTQPDFAVALKVC